MLGRVAARLKPLLAPPLLARPLLPRRNPPERIAQALLRAQPPVAPRAPSLRGAPPGPAAARPGVEDRPYGAAEVLPPAKFAGRFVEWLREDHDEAAGRPWTGAQVLLLMQEFCVQHELAPLAPVTLYRQLAPYRDGEPRPLPSRIASESGRERRIQHYLFPPLRRRKPAGAFEGQEAPAFLRAGAGAGGEAERRAA